MSAIYDSVDHGEVVFKDSPVEGVVHPGGVEELPALAEEDQSEVQVEGHVRQGQQVVRTPKQLD